MKIKEHENERLKIRIGYKRSFPDWKLFRTDFIKIKVFSNPQIRSNLNLIQDNNEKLYKDADEKLDKLEKSINILHALSNELNCMKSESDEMINQCMLIKGKVSN